MEVQRCGTSWVSHVCGHGGKCLYPGTWEVEAGGLQEQDSISKKDKPESKVELQNNYSDFKKFSFIGLQLFICSHNIFYFELNQKELEDGPWRAECECGGYVCDPTGWKAEAEGSSQVHASLGYTVSSRPTGTSEWDRPIRHCVTGQCSLQMLLWFERKMSLEARVLNACSQLALFRAAVETPGGGFWSAEVGCDTSPSFFLAIS